MEYQRLFEYLRTKFETTEEPLQAVLRARTSYQGKPYGLIYFDCTQRVLESTFDLAQYQRTLLAEDYYTASGSLQWNFYLYLICEADAYRGLLANKRIEAIEADKVFARKFVRTPDDLISEVDQATTSLEGRQSTSLRGDLAIRWMDKLKAGKLDGVFLKEEGYQAVVDAFMAGTPRIQVEEDVLESSENNGLDIAFVKSLTFKQKYRHFKPQVFEFGSVNLIQGPNGTGKTSLLEGIEACICGANFRNMDKQDGAGLIEILFRDQSKAQLYDPSNTSLFRKRDHFWYKNYYMRGNHLCIGFNRFNFYDTDSGARLVGEDASDRSLRDAFTGLLIGETANMIQERAERFFQMFQSEKSTYERLIAEVSSRISQSQDEFRRAGSPEFDQTPLREAFVSDYQKCRLRADIPDISHENLNLLANDLDQVSLRLESCLSEVYWVHELTWERLKQEKENLGKAQNEFNALERGAGELRNSLQEAISQLQPVNHRAGFFRRLEPYVEDPEGRELFGLQKRTTDSEQAVKRLADAWAFVATMDLLPYVSSEQSLSASQAALSEQIQQTEARKQEVEQRIQTILNAAQTAKRVVAEIRSKAMELLQLQPDRDECPVCRAHYDIGELGRRLSEEQEAQGPNSLIELLNSRSDLESDLSKLRLQHDDFGRMAYVLSLMSHPSESIAVQEAVRVLKGISARIRESEEMVASLSALKRRLEARQLVESELDLILESLRMAGVPFDLRYPERFQEIKNVFEEQIRVLQQRGLDLEKQLADNDRARKQILSLALPDSEDTVTSSTFLNARCAQIERAYSLALETEAKVVLDRPESIDQIILLVKSLKLSCQNLAQSVKPAADELRIGELQRRIEADTAELGKLAKQQVLAEQASAVLNEILTIESKGRYLEEVFKAHRSDILRIFSSIHAPKEFKDMSFEHEGELEIRLVNANDDTRRRLSEISTGQRSAFALSIFLALNGLLKAGPPLILLDDPIAHVDDLNTLSFMDYLRRLAIDHKRQVFFATANPKLANLFRKKFDFLGDTEFRNIQLSRG
jgi:exonuclease SbcC